MAVTLFCFAEVIRETSPARLRGFRRLLRHAALKITAALCSVRSCAVLCSQAEGIASRRKAHTEFVADVSLVKQLTLQPFSV